MSGALRTTADHARRMSEAQHTDECTKPTPPWLKPRPRPGCAGCVTASDRALWAQIANEIDTYLGVRR
jgi:hypothetical protein